MSKPPPLGKLSIGFEQCATCDENTSGLRVDGDCPTCGGVGTTPYWRPPRWVELMLAIVTRTDRCGGWFLGLRDSERVVIGGRRRAIHAENEGPTKRSTRMLVEKGLALVDHIQAYTPTESGREALRWALYKFDAACERKGPPPRKLTPSSPRKRPTRRSPSQLHAAPAKIALLGERPGLHYKAHLARARLKDPTLSERALGRELWPDASKDSRRGKLRNLKTTIQHHPDTITTIAAHFGVAPESFYAPIEAAGE